MLILWTILCWFHFPKINGSWYNDFCSFWPFLATFDPLWSFLGNFEHFRSPEGYTLYEKQIETWGFWAKWGVKRPLKPTYSLDIAYIVTFSPFTGCSDHFSNFWGFLSILEVYNVWNNNQKVGLAVKMRGLKCFYDLPLGGYTDT